jgi:hypothetical protein
MEPQNTQNTQTDAGEDRVNLLSKRIIGCALTVFHTLGTGFLEKSMKTLCCTNSVSLELRGNIAWSFDTTG